MDKRKGGKWKRGAREGGRGEERERERGERWGVTGR